MISEGGKHVMLPDSWAADGWDAQYRIGLLVPHADVGPECEFQAMAMAGVTIHAARVGFDAMAAGGTMNPTIALAPVRAFAESPALDAAAALLAAAPVDVIAFAFTSSAYVVGSDGETAMIERLARATRGIPIVAASTSTLAALRELRIERLALVTPPWFDDELTALGRAFFEDGGHRVVAAASAELESDQRAITAEGLYEWVRRYTPEGAEAVVIAGNGLRAVGVIAALEEALGRPVITANQALLWAALRAADAPGMAIPGYGVLLGKGAAVNA